MRTMTFAGEMSRCTKPSPTSLEAHEDVEQVAADPGSSQGREAPPRIDRQDLARLVERHALDPLHHDRRLARDRPVSVEPREALEPGEGALDLVFLAERRAAALPSGRMGLVLPPSARSGATSVFRA